MIVAGRLQTDRGWSARGWGARGVAVLIEALICATDSITGDTVVITAEGRAHRVMADCEHSPLSVLRAILEKTI